MSDEWQPEERLFENWVARDPARVSWPGARLLGRQLSTGSGRLDLLIFEPAREGRREPPGVTVVELKRDVIDLETIAQVSRYMNDINSVWPDLPNVIPDSIDYNEYPELRGLLVAPDITDGAAEVVVAMQRLRFVSVVPSIEFTPHHHAIDERDSVDRTYLVDISAGSELVEKVADAVMVDRGG